MLIEQMRLGVQTNPFIGHIERVAFWKCQVWAPKRAKSFTYTFYHTNYHGIATHKVTGYATISVSYFTDKKSGEYLVDTPANIAKFKRESDLVGFNLFESAQRRDRAARYLSDRLIELSNIS